MDIKISSFLAVIPALSFFFLYVNFAKKSPNRGVKASALFFITYIIAFLIFYYALWYGCEAGPVSINEMLHFTYFTNSMWDQASLHTAP